MSSDFESLRLPPGPIVRARARDAAETIARRAGANAERALDAAIVTSELVSNAARVATVVEVRFALQGPVLRIEVDDDGEGEPHLIDGSENGGFGLRLVEELSSRWGCDIDRGTKTVWAEVDHIVSPPTLRTSD